MNKSDLTAILNEVQSITDSTWISSLNQRKKEELEFHDNNRDKTRVNEIKHTDQYEKFYGNKKYYKYTSASRQFQADWIKNNAKGKVFLDYACGDGENALSAAEAGAELAIGLDISSVSVDNAAAKANEKGLTSNTFFLQADAENTKLPDNSIDCIICCGMLHHLDLSYAFPELRRILKPGGRLLAIEALDYNPLIKLYRMLTPDMRTNWEKHHILSLKSLRFAKHFFNVENVKYWHMTSILSPHLRFLHPVFSGVDKVFTKVPLLQLMSWMFTFELVKKEEK